MATIENGFLKGQFGNLVGRQVGDKQVVQSAPRRSTKRSKATEDASEDFGYCSNLGSVIRRTLCNTHLQLHDQKMHNRLIKQLQRVIRASPNPISGFNTLRAGKLDRLVGFQFNDKCHLQDYLFVDPTVWISDEDQRVHVSIPSFHKKRHLHIPQKKKCTHICLQIEAMALHGRDGYLLGTQEIAIPMRTGDTDISPETQLTFEIPPYPLDIVLVSLSVLYMDRIGSIMSLQNSKELHPAAIIGAFALG